ncbi:hypothetical protein AB0L59_36930 [Streptomyces sp. NPDC052109]|uniref:hypothetical protein n=1 Tax=Streptomyces sp. NPDC052109 TaxID=3155527 RepID=UPI00343B0F86
MIRVAVGFGGVAFAMPPTGLLPRPRPAPVPVRRPSPLPGLLPTGLGPGTAFVPVFVIATGGIAPQHSGGRSAALAATRHLGVAIGSALLRAAGRPRSPWCAAATSLLTALPAGPMSALGREERPRRVFP